MAKAVGPSKKDMQTILRQYSGYGAPEGKAADALKKQAEVADKTVDRFLSMNKAYRALVKKQSSAWERYHKASKSFRERLQERVAECYLVLRLKGVTPELVKMVEKLVKDFK